MKKVTILALGLALMSAMPVGAQTRTIPMPANVAGLSDPQMIKYAESQNACPGGSVLSAFARPDGKVQVVCQGVHGAVQKLGTLGGVSYFVPAVTVVFIAAALGSSSNTTGTN